MIQLIHFTSPSKFRPRHQIQCTCWASQAKASGAACLAWWPSFSLKFMSCWNFQTTEKKLCLTVFDSILLMHLNLTFIFPIIILIHSIFFSFGISHVLISNQSRGATHQKPRFGGIQGRQEEIFVSHKKINTVFGYTNWNMHRKTWFWWHISQGKLRVDNIRFCRCTCLVTFLGTYFLVQHQITSVVWGKTLSEFDGCPTISIKPYRLVTSISRFGSFNLLSLHWNKTNLQAAHGKKTYEIIGMIGLISL